MFRNWLRLFLLTILGFPIVATLIDLTDNLKKLLDRGIPISGIALGYVYLLPEKMFEIIPAAVLVATVFTVGTLGRHSELTAAKAGGISFHRFVLPIYVGAVFAAGLCLAVEELAPAMTERKVQIHGERAGSAGTALQLRLPGGARVGLHRAHARLAQPSTHRCRADTAGHRPELSIARHHRGQRHLGQHRLAPVGRVEPGHRQRGGAGQLPLPDDAAHDA